MHRIIFILALSLGMNLFVAAQEKNSQLFFLNNADTVLTGQLLTDAKKVRAYAPDSAILLALRALDHSKHDVVGRADALLLIGACLFDKEEFLKSKAYFIAAIPHSIDASRTQERILPRLYNNLANVNNKLGYNDSAIFYYRKSLKEVFKARALDSGMLMLVYANLGGSLATSEQNDEAVYYLDKSIQLSGLLKDSASLAQNYSNMALFYETTKKDLGTSITYLNKAVLLYKMLNDKDRLQEAYYQMGRVMGRKQDLALCGKYFDSAFAVDHNLAAGNNDLQRGMGDLYSAMGQYNEAIGFYHNALRLVTQKGGGYNVSNLYLYKGMSDCYEKINNSKLAYKYLKLYTGIRDSLMGNDKTRMVNDLEIQYRTAEKDKELIGQRFMLTVKENKLREKNFWIAAVTILGVILLTWLFSYYRSRQKLQRKVIVEMEHKREMDRLYTAMQVEEQERSRIARDLHDGVGVLISALKMNYTVLGKIGQPPVNNTPTYKDGIGMLDEMKQELRTIAHNLLPEQLANQNLIDVVRQLANRLQKDHTLKIEIRIYGQVIELRPERIFSVYRILEELMNNTVKHSGASLMVLQFMFHEEHVNITVEDNGKGFDPGAVENGMGLQNLRIRTENLQGVLSINSEKGKYTMVELEIPYF